MHQHLGFSHHGLYESDDDVSDDDYCYFNSYLCYRCRVNENIGRGPNWRYCDVCIQTLSKPKHVALPFLKDAALAQIAADSEKVAGSAVADLIKTRDQTRILSVRERWNKKQESRRKKKQKRNVSDSFTGSV